MKGRIGTLIRAINETLLPVYLTHIVFDIVGIGKDFFRLT